MDHSRLTELAHPKVTLYIGFSGGADSVCLAHQLKTFFRPNEAPTLRCLHIDHGLDPNSAERAVKAKHLANSLGLECEVVTLALQSQSNQEAVARQARYRVFEQRLDTGDLIATAHHQDDVAETLLLRMLRGSGVTGLSGIQATQTFGLGYLIRPLLTQSRGDIIAYLNEHALDWIEDPTNECLDLDRNFIRHKIMPVLQAKFPQTNAALARSAHLNRQAAHTIAKWVSDELDQRLITTHQLDLAKWSDLDSFMQTELIRAWALRCRTQPPPGKPLDEFIRQLEKVTPDRQPCLSWHDVQIRFYDQMLWLEPRPTPDHPEGSTYQLHWTGDQPLQLPNALGKLILDKTQISETLKTQLTIQSFCVSSAKTGEQFGIRPDGKTTKPNELLGQHKVPPWQRPTWPRVWLGDQLLALGDQWQHPELNQALNWIREDTSVMTNGLESKP